MTSYNICHISLCSVSFKSLILRHSLWSSICLLFRIVTVPIVSTSVSLPSTAGCRKEPLLPGWVSAPAFYILPAG
uniref:Uncharacterized protein n=1 Tax=Castor canadensis TaxID=51338 RepID=A0A8C0XE70_CASCN